MKKLSILVFLFISVISYSQPAKPAIIPEPVSVTGKTGEFILKKP
jgi:hypothetical protein